MLKALKYTLLFIAITCGSLLSQNETNKWYFGQQAGLDFMTNPPTALTTGSTAALEGCASIADANGNLVLYTDGLTIYGNNHTMIANGNGLWGWGNFTQSSLIIKKPGSNTIYFLFTVSSNTALAGAHYSIIDMSLAGGQGSVTAKNQNLSMGSFCGKIAGAKHCNGVDFWIVYKDFPAYAGNPSSTGTWTGTTNFYAFLLSNGGISNSAIITPFTYSFSNSLSSISLSVAKNGCMKISPTGKKIACANYTGNNPNGVTTNFGLFELFDFDNSTGAVTNSLVLMTHTISSFINGNITHGHGVEFSPDASKLYGSLVNGPTSQYGYLYQWNLCAGSATSIVASRTLIAASTTTNNSLATLQLASNGKIYGACNYRGPSLSNSLSVINNPNALGAACNFSIGAQSLAGRGSGNGLPNFITTNLLQRPTPPVFTHTVSNAFGCQAAAFSATIIQNFTQIACSALGYSIVNFYWNFGDPNSGAANTSTLTNPIHAYSSLGTYTAQLIVNYSCGGGNDTIRAQININQLCSTINSQSITCSSLGSATIQTSNGVGPFTYTWLPSNQTGSVATNLNPGTHTIIVRDNFTLLSTTNTVVFTPLLPLTGNLNITPSITCYGATTGTAGYSGVANGSTLQIYSWINGISNFTSNATNISTLSAGTWTSIVTDALTGCTINNTFTITQPPALTINISANTATACPNGSINLSSNTSGGTPNYSYNWFFGQSAISQSAASSASISEAIAGNYTYTLTVFDTYSCNTSNTVSVTFVPNPMLNFSNVSICPLETATLNVSGANNYTFYPSSTSLGVTASSASTTLGVTFTASPVSSQQFAVSGEALGCSSAASAFVIIKPLPVPVLSSNSPVCEGKSLVLSCNSGTSHVWTGANAFVSAFANNTINPVTLAANGVYNVTVTAANSCTAATSGTVLVKPLPTVSVSPSSQSMCAGVQSVQLNATGSATLFNWLPNQSISNTVGANVFVFPSSNKTYTAMGSLNGCTAVAMSTVYVVPPPNLNIALSSNSLCAQALSGSPNTITLTSSGAGSYSIVTPQYIHNQNPAGPSSTLSLVQPYLNTGPATATLYGSNGVCTVSTSAVFTVVPNPSVAVSNPTPVICAGQSFTYTNSGASSYVWSSSTPGSTLYTTGNVAVANPSINSVFSVFGGSLGCNSAIQNVVITVNPLPIVYVSPNPTFICKGVATELTALGNATTFTWQPSLWLSNNNSAVVKANPPQLQTYTVFATLNNCTNSAMATVSVLALPNPSIVSNQTTLCVNQDLVLEGFGALHYHWLAPNKLAYSGKKLSVVMSNLSFAGLYTLTAIDSNNCIGTSNIHIDIENLPSGYLKNSQTFFCAPYSDTYTFVPSLNTLPNMRSFSWSVNDVFVSSSASFSYTFLKAGTYFIKGDIKAGNGCANSVIMTVTAMPKPMADFSFSPDKPVENLDEVLFVANEKGVRDFEWTVGVASGKWLEFSGGGVNKIFENAGTFPIVLVVSNEFNCYDTIIKPITILPDLGVYIPNAFTPNGDNKNEVFVPVIRSAQSLYFVVFDRWGEKVFETTELNVGWDGTFRGADCKQDVYVWKLNVQGFSGEAHGLTNEKKYTGQVLLVR